MTPDKLVRMANQIATFFATQPEAGQVAEVARHIHDFWEPRMRAQLFAHVDAGGTGLHPLVLSAVAQLRAAAPAAQEFS